MTRAIASVAAVLCAAGLFAQTPTCQGAATGATASPHLDKGRFKASAGEAHVGYLIANVEGSPEAPTRYCLEDGALYQGAPYRLGRVNVFVSGAVPSKALNGPALIYGRRVTGLASKVTRIGPCPASGKEIEPQMRSDWVADEADWQGRSTRARLLQADYIEALAVYPLPIVAVRPSGEAALRLTLTNPFDQPLPAATQFSLYYEGGPKKPMPRFDAQPLKDLAPGGSQTFAVALPPRGASATKPGGGLWSFRGYQLKGQIGDVRLDLLVSLPAR